MIARAACTDEYLGRDITFNIILKISKKSAYNIVLKQYIFIFVSN